MIHPELAHLPLRIYIEPEATPAQVLVVLAAAAVMEFLVPYECKCRDHDDE